MEGIPFCWVEGIPLRRVEGILFRWVEEGIPFCWHLIPLYPPDSPPPDPALEFPVGEKSSLALLVARANQAMCDD